MFFFCFDWKYVCGLRMFHVWWKFDTIFFRVEWISPIDSSSPHIAHNNVWLLTLSWCIFNKISLFNSNSHSSPTKDKISHLFARRLSKQKHMRCDLTDSFIFNAHVNSCIKCCAIIIATKMTKTKQAKLNEVKNVKFISHFIVQCELKEEKQHTRHGRIEIFSIFHSTRACIKETPTTKIYK